MGFSSSRSAKEATESPATYNTLGGVGLVEDYFAHALSDRLKGFVSENGWHFVLGTWGRCDSNAVLNGCVDADELLVVACQRNEASA